VLSPEIKTETNSRSATGRSTKGLTPTLNNNIQGVSAKTFEPNILVICQRIFVKFKMQTF
jgi:hypothetical protein